METRDATAVAREVCGMGCYEVSLADTAGVGTHAPVERMCEETKRVGRASGWIAGRSVLSASAASSDAAHSLRNGCIISNVNVKIIVSSVMCVQRMA